MSRHASRQEDAMGVFDTIGGAPVVRAAVDELYARLRGDATLSEYFVDLDMARLKAHQRSFIAAAIGGPEVYSGREMAVAHRGLGITDDDFDAVVRHLVDTLAALGAPTAVLARIGTRLARLRRDVVTAPPRTALGA
ncbi:group I truncated hemoglobin [Pseudonocardia humida]|uniref:Group 1 truncated hemoglobin n=1 Tax=Pseudonocardia humida TaxID=2800819 RepID=A0ABT1A8P7_9PSEU|nr:group 1 truncated hemoglobin [Pseudonocardia humida]MCO1659410.1 group 1 truncated hemoglobin [Pseudonocardia humida]